MDGFSNKIKEEDDDLDFNCSSLLSFALVVAIIVELNNNFLVWMSLLIVMTSWGLCIEMPNFRTKTMN